MKIEIKRLTGEMLPLAGNLLAQRHKRNRGSLPLLPLIFEDPQSAENKVRDVWRAKPDYGYAAFRDQIMVAFLIGERITQPWGRCGYIYMPGYAIADGESTTVLQDLYARLGDDWIGDGVFNHGVYVSAADKHVIDALFDIGFGKERVDAMLDLRLLNIPAFEEPKNIIIRPAGTGDNDLLGNLSHIIMQALASPPCWHPTVPEDYLELKEGWSELADDKDWKVWLAIEKETSIGCVGFDKKNDGDQDMLTAPKTVYLSIAATTSMARRRGIANILTWHGLDQARKEGFEICYTNWISPNLLASRFWPRFGFKDVAYRLAKKVDPMISWTRKK